MNWIEFNFSFHWKLYSAIVNVPHTDNNEDPELFEDMEEKSTFTLLRGKATRNKLYCLLLLPLVDEVNIIRWNEPIVPCEEKNHFRPRRLHIVLVEIKEMSVVNDCSGSEWKCAEKNGRKPPEEDKRKLPRNTCFFSCVDCSSSNACFVFAAYIW